MVCGKGRKKWQEKAYVEAHDRLKKTLIEAKKGMTKTELHKATGLARTTIDRHLSVLENVSKQVQKIGKRYFWGDKYNALVKGLKEDAALVEELDVFVNRSKDLINKMARPENLRKWRQNGAFIPSEETSKKGYPTPEEVTGLLEHKEKVFGGLRRAFADLARVLVKVEGPADIRDDLSNVTFKFINGHPLLYVRGKFKHGRGAYYIPHELVEMEEENTRLAEKKREREGEQGIPVSVMLPDGHGTMMAEEEEVDLAAKRSGKTKRELLEQLRKERAEKQVSDYSPKAAAELEAAIEERRLKLGFKPRTKERKVSTEAEKRGDR